MRDDIDQCPTAHQFRGGGLQELQFQPFLVAQAVVGIGRVQEQQRNGFGRQVAGLPGSVENPIHPFGCQGRARRGKFCAPTCAVQGACQDGSRNPFASAGVEQASVFGGREISFEQVSHRVRCGVKATFFQSGWSHVVLLSGKTKDPAPLGYGV